MFKLDNVNIETGKLETDTVKTRIGELFHGQIEACVDGSLIDGKLHGSWPALISTVQVAFNNHYVLILDPDSIWVTIEAGIAQHIRLHSESMRSKFVDFDGKKLLSIERDNFVKGEVNDWPSVFSEFCSLIGEKGSWLISDFSTTTDLKRAVSSVVLMDAMSVYYDYEVVTRCGIPGVKIEGLVSDWKMIKERVEKFEEFGLGWWKKELLAVINEIIQAKIGSPDLGFWKSFYNENGMSGGPYIGGHVLKFYPYDVKDKRMDWGKSISVRDLGMGISKVPFVWKYFGMEYNMDFIGGLLGVEQREDGVGVGFGWAICERVTNVIDMKVGDFKKDMLIYSSEDVVGRLLDCVVDYGTYRDGSEWQTLVYIEVDWDGEVVKHYRDRWQGEGDVDGLYVKL